MPPILEIRNLKFETGQIQILDLPELLMDAGKVLVVLGPNGAGKSTLLQITAGLKKPTSGKVMFVDEPNLSDLKYRRRIATVFQSPLLLSDSVENNIASGLRFRGIPITEVHRRVNKWMEMLHISHLAKRRSTVLSGGEAQRVSLARAFCLETQLLLMDEPFSALDTPTRQQLLDDLRSIFAETNQTCIYVTHNLEEAMAIGDQVAVLFDGRLHQLGPTREVFTHPNTPETAAFLGIETIIPGQVVDNHNSLLQIQADGVTVEAVGILSTGSQVFICLRPEDITLFEVDQASQRSTARNRIPCRVTRMTHQGPFIRVHLDAGFPLVALITRPSADEMRLEPGKELVAAFKASAIHLIPTGKHR